MPNAGCAIPRHARATRASSAAMASQRAGFAPPLRHHNGLVRAAHAPRRRRRRPGASGAGDLALSLEHCLPARDDVSRMAIALPCCIACRQCQFFPRRIVVKDDEQVDVAVRTGIPSGERAEQDDPPRVEVGHYGIKQLGRDTPLGHDATIDCQISRCLRPARLYWLMDSRVRAVSLRRRPRLVQIRHIARRSAQHRRLRHL